MDDWDADGFEPTDPVAPKVAINKWEGEDEEEDVKDSWEDEDNEEEKKDQEKPPEAQSAASRKPKNNLKKIVQEKDRKLKEEIALKEEAKRAMKNLSPAELQAEKMRQRKLQEEAELELVKATYGVDVDDSPSGIDNANPSSKEDFDKLREAITNKVQDLSKSEHFVEFVLDLVQNMCINLPAADLKKISTQLTSLANEKSKMDKAASSKKKGGKFKGAKLKLDDKDLTSELGEFGDEYDDFI